MNQRWALKRRIRRISRSDYVAALEGFIAAFKQTFGTSITVELKVYDRPMRRPTRVDRHFPPLDLPVKRLPQADMLTPEDWAENRVFECIIKADDVKNGPSAVFASIQAGKRYPRQITFYLQGIDAEEQVRLVYDESTKASGLAVVGGKAAWRGFHN